MSIYEFGDWERGREVKNKILPNFPKLRKSYNPVYPSDYSTILLKSNPFFGIKRSFSLPYFEMYSLTIQ
jgi:hypothetical protein